MSAGLVHAAPVNLIVNGSNDEPLVSGNIPGWIEVVGANWTQRDANPDPFDGSYYFFPGVASTAELAQVVDLSAFADSFGRGTAECVFTGVVRSWPQSPPDSSRIVLEYRDATESIVDTFDSGDIADPSAWQPVADTRIPPPTTRSVRIRLISIRNAGTNNDGYYDALSLVVESVEAPCAADLNGDGIVDGDDLGGLLGEWGPCAGCESDFNGDGEIDGDDLGTLLGAWGPCPTT